MDTQLWRIWVYLAETPLVGLTVTLAAYLIGDWLYRRARLNPLVNPVLIAVVLLVGLLMATGTDYPTYFQGAQFVHFLLGPATVALAVPLYRQFRQVRRHALPLLVALVAGSLTAAGSAVGIAWALGGSLETLLSLAPKSVTTPVAMGISQQIGGLPSLTAVLVILTGIAGAVLAPHTLNLLRIRDWKARGFAMGVTAHGIGTARALQVNEVAGAFSGLAMGLNALATAALLPLLIRLVFG
ncbi:TIGR00659 family protein [Tistlia consotensis]|uniref:TIGR00659 family protein n=1 Tax=Tistlia consotensis USBA 355 TaxID=560819 RepID=A0A1Y6CAB1_9PROT|nr:LrgB family protein [Tistlia consotensis]SMF44374.1 TIGR00659 family protein [Tistlia consotensis USBA 355]SNR43223.1 TIGR00659 family protein [Tistlia consotensis]